MMLKGQRPAECSYCWKIEDIGRDNISDRVYKSRIYSEEDIKRISKTPFHEDVNLKTVELSFDRTDSASRWLVGSSSNKRSGASRSNLQSATRRFSPPDKTLTSASGGGQRKASIACSSCESSSQALR